MNKRSITKWLAFKTVWIVVLLLMSCFIQNNASAQINIDPAKVILNDTLKFDTPATGLLKKIIQPIQFRGNRNKRENQRIYNFMLDRISKGELNIDTNTVKQIMFQLENVNTSTVTNKDSILKIKGSIEKIIANNNLTTKASKEVIDSLKTQMSAVIQENAANTSQEKKDFEKSIEDELKDIQKVQYSQTSGKARLDSMEVDSTKYHIKRWLTPKIKIIGWHNSWLKDDEYLHYNYNYLSAVNVFGYELDPNGRALNESFITEIQQPGKIINFAQIKGCEVYLTVYNKRPEDISKFLNNNKAQNILLESLNDIIVKNYLKGINVFFERMNKTDAEKFVQFIAFLRSNLNPADSTFQIQITLPAVSSTASIKEIDAYNFSELDPMVDFYQVLTDRIIGPNVEIAQATSPLFSSNKYQNRSVESTIGSYVQLGIAPSKIIMSVSYLGIEWPVKDFSGTLQPKGQKNITYADIIKKYPLGTVGDMTVSENFDPDQAAPFLNVITSDQNNLKQIWYEDSRSLYLKYIWALEQGLGGVALKNPGYDDGHPELWNALGAALIKIDTFRVDSISLKKPVQEEKVRFPILTYAWKGFKFKTFKQDLSWATVVRLKFDSTYVDTAGHKFEYYRYAEIDSLKKQNAIKEYVLKPIIWDETMSFDEATQMWGEYFLKDRSYCYSLYARWTLYAWFFKWGGVILAILSIVFWLISTNSDRYLQGTERVRKITRNVPSAFILFTLFFVSLWLYIDPYFTSFGAGSEGGTENLILVYSVIAGITFGWFVAFRYFKYKGS